MFCTGGSRFLFRIWLLLHQHCWEAAGRGPSALWMTELSVSFFLSLPPPFLSLPLPFLSLSLSFLCPLLAHKASQAYKVPRGILCSLLCLLLHGRSPSWEEWYWRKLRLPRKVFSISLHRNTVSARYRISFSTRAHILEARVFKIEGSGCGFLSRVTCSTETHCLEMASSASPPCQQPERKTKSTDKVCGDSCWTQTHYRFLYDISESKPMANDSNKGGRQVAEGATVNTRPLWSENREKDRMPGYGAVLRGEAWNYPLFCRCSAGFWGGDKCARQNVPHFRKMHSHLTTQCSRSIYECAPPKIH